jgi:hypothetical protein
MTLIDDTWYSKNMTPEEKLIQIKKLIDEEWNDSHMLCFDLAAEILHTIEAIIEK